MAPARKKEQTASERSLSRAVIGTMTTTLLLAYFGGYLTLLMLFARQNTVFVRVINYRIIAAKILRTMAGV